MLLAVHLTDVLGDALGVLLVGDDEEGLTSLGDAAQTCDLHRLRGARRGHIDAAMIDHVTHAAILLTDDDDVTDAQGAALNEDRGQGAAAFIESRLDDDALSVAIGASGQLADLGLEEQGLHELVDVDAF